MYEMSPASVIVVIAALGVAALLIFLGRGGRLRSVNFNVLKGLLRFWATLDTKLDRTAIASHPNDEAPRDLAHGIIQWLREHKPQKVLGCYVLTDSTHDNAQVAAKLFTRVDGDVIATCFFESPFYGRGDFASTIAQKARFTRLTVADACGEELAAQVRGVFKTMPCKARLVVVPQGVEISKIGGIFCHLSDRSFLAFIALNNAEDSSSNRGLVFSGTLAEELFAYFRGFAEKFGADPR